jgi:oligopeptidase B
MRFVSASLLTASIVWLVSCSGSPERKPPVAKAVPKQLEKHGDVRTDNYFWLRERDNPEVKAYLTAENEYAAAMMEHTKPLQEALFNEFKTRIKQTDMSVPYKRDDYFYYSRTEEGKQYPIFCRKKGSIEGAEQIMLDVNQIAAGHKYCSATMPQVSSGQNLGAYGVDTVGRLFFTLYVKNLETGELLKDVIPNVRPSVAWANDNKTFFYTRQHPTTLRNHQIYRHVLGTDPAKDQLVYEEKDETFTCFAFKTKSKKYILIGSHQTLSSEFWYLDANNPTGKLQVIQPREKDHEYSVDHFGDQFYIRTNLKAKNFRLMKTPVGRPGAANWQEVLPHRDDVLFEGFETFRDYLVVSERKLGLLQLRVMPWSGKGEHYLEFGEPAYTVYPGQNFDFDTKLVRYNYSSMTTPPSVYDYNMETREKKLLKRQEVLAGFDSANYQTERIQATAADGTKVPVSLVYRKGFKKDGSAPLWIYGYGSYGATMDAGFDPLRVSLLDRGFVFAIAHIRGGEEMGRRWYEDGKLLKKKNTFTDFIACTDHLVKEKYADPKRVFASGASAGGLLMGAVVNMRPGLYKGVVAKVPFVDVITTMLDSSVPLTTGEYDEWGNPNDKTYYDYMLSYSPYDQVKQQSYPNLLVTTSFQDSQVQYWEPAKWVAKLRAMKTDKNRILLKTEMEASHGGLSGRYDRYRQIALDYAFVLDVAGINK